MKLDRLLGILTILLQNDRVTAPHLAERFEVTRRTIGRDIEALCMAGIPIVTHQGSGGGISIAEGYKLDKSVLTMDELSSIIAALKGIGSVTERSQVEQTLQKLSLHGNAVVSLREPVVIDLASHYKGSLTAKIELFKQAIRENLVVEFDYYYEKGETHRRIEPCFVIFQWIAWYIFGFCPERQDFRLFKLQRLWDLRLTNERFAPREIPADKLPGTGFPDDKTLVALFQPSERYKLIEDYGLHCYEETRDGLRLEVGYTNRDYMLGWILSFRDRVKVLEPADMAEEIRRIAEKMVSLYD